jgi:hypothetical protein
MPIMATAGESKSFAPAPEGVHQAVCVDVVDLGVIPGFGGKPQHKIVIVWQIDERRDDETRYLLFKKYTLSLNEKATLRKDLEAWRGRAFTRDEELGFDVETVKGVNCMANVQHRQSQDGSRLYANVVSLTPLPKALRQNLLKPEKYERPENLAKAAKEQREEPDTELTDDDIPFSSWIVPFLLPAFFALHAVVSRMAA